jgi:hypothetical protein
MFVAIQHTITDPRKWDEITEKLTPMIEHGQLPKDMRPVFYLPSTDGRKALCLWEVDSVENLKRFLDPYTSPASRNEYFQISVEHAFGLPVHTPEKAHVC